MASSIGRSSFFSLLAGWVNLPIGIVTNVVLARVLGPELKGLYSVFLTTQGLLLIPGFAIQTALIHFVARDQPDLSALKRMINWLAIAQAAISVLLLAVAIQFPSIRSLIFAGLSPLYLLAVLVTVTASLWFYYRSAIVLGLEMWVRFQFWSTIGLAMSGGLLILFLGTWWLAGWTILLPEVIGITLLSTICVTLLWGLVTSRITTPESRPVNNKQIRKVLTKFGGPMLIRNGLEWLNYSAGLYFINGFIGAREVGLYTIALGLSQQIGTIPAAIAGPLFTRVSREGDTAESRRVTLYAFRVMLLVSLTLGLLAAIVTPLVIPLVYGNRFENAVAIFFALLPGVVAIGPARALVSFLLGSSRAGEPLRAELVSLCGIIPINMLLVPHLGGIGAGLAISVGYTSYVLFLCFRFVALTESRWRELVAFQRNDLTMIRNRTVELVRSVLRIRGWGRSVRQVITFK